MEKSDAYYLILIVAIGLFIFSLTSIAANGFTPYKLYPLILGIFNLYALWILKKK